MILAAGAGARLGSGGPKAFLRLAGRPMAAFALEAAAASGAVDGLVLVVPAGGDPAEVDSVVAAVREAVSLEVPIEVTEGGPTRQESVRRGLAMVPGGAEVVVIHDAARPFASARLFARVVEALNEGRNGARADGAIPVIPSPDTVKRVRDGRVTETIARDGVALSQTPQAFKASALRVAHERAARDGVDATDDAMLLEAAGFEVLIVAGEASNFKITTREDLERAERLVSDRPPSGGSDRRTHDGKVT